jgi:4-diphosphocytidyl-2-C-methyl-D-erythritol kinase
VTAGRLAPAKVNLFLHVGPPDAEGYHPLASLMTFADVGDRLHLRPAPGLSLAVEGPFGEGLSAGEDNLVLKAARSLLAEVGLDDAPVQLVLDKQLPLAAGLGGGSADAGAALRLLNAALDLELPDARLEALAAALGADGAACFRTEPVIAEGRGERLTPAPDWAPLPCVLVNPGAPSPTAAVYRAYDAGARFSDVAPPILPLRADVPAAVEALRDLRNDLEAAAVRLQPVIGETLEVLRDQPETLLARMSGSGATCFALCLEQAAAEALAARLARPGWWVRACRLG